MPTDPLLFILDVSYGRKTRVLCGSISSYSNESPLRGWSAAVGLMQASMLRIPERPFEKYVRFGVRQSHRQSRLPTRIALPFLPRSVLKRSHDTCYRDRTVECGLHLRRRSTILRRCPDSGNYRFRCLDITRPTSHSPPSLSSVFRPLSTMTRISLPFLTLLGLASARDIVFPPVAAMQQPIGSFAVDIAEDPALDISGARYLGLTTYANLPYVHCLAAEGEEVEAYDIAFLGAPFDTVCLESLYRYQAVLILSFRQGVTARPGARFGPNGIRQGSRRIEEEAAWNVYTGMVW